MTAYITLPLTEYEALRNAATHNTPDRSTTFDDSLAAAVATLTARQSGIHTTASQLVPDINPDAIIWALTSILTAVLHITTHDHGTDLLQDLGLLAADGNPQ